MERKGVVKRFGVGKQAPPELLDLPTPAEESQSMRPSAVRAMFAKPAKPAKPLIKKRSTSPLLKPAAAAEELVNTLEKSESLGLTDDLKEMGDLILEEERRDLYNTEVPTAYVPQTRRGFANFIKTTYKEFQLPNGPITIPEGEKYYPYQKFVRDYMRKESPYRGILVYHGLGSGKTCTAIAASEALFATDKKKIIVMSPKSLKANFLKEISFCGFRHFQLNNFWVPLDITDPMTTLFANQVYGLSGKYLKNARNVWVPDFRKPQSESNYESLPDEDRAEIRKQILAIVEWDPVNNPSGRIRFISYNGITAKKLMAMACDPVNKFFDNSVIVVDEIHNLIRLIQGTIQPYLSKAGPGGKKVRRTVPVEEITPNRWKPTLCAEGTKMYTRGYLFYRLLLDAQNTKIIGLSGTPLINFPEELGILANVLHGYITTLEGNIQMEGDLEKNGKEIAFKHPYVDFVEFTKNPKGGKKVLMSLLPPGIRKIENEIGVMRIPKEERQPTMDEIVKSIEDAFEKGGMAFSGPLKPTAEALLPPFGDTFSEHFISGKDIKAKGVLTTRLTGLVSYYKGSRLELMPRVKVDEVVKVPFSLYAQKAYSFKRSTEVKSEMESKGGQTIDAVWAQVYELGDSAAANNYKMGSRQACNFVFPPEVVRPSASITDREAEARQGAAVAGIIELAPEEENENEEEFVQLGREEENMEEVAQEDQRLEAEIYGEAVPVVEVPEVPAPAVPDPTVSTPVVPATKGKTLKARATAIPSADVIRFSNKMDNEYKLFDTYAPTPITITTAGEEDTFPTLEHYYQAIKFRGSDPEWYKQVRDAPTPAKARDMGADKTHTSDSTFSSSRINIMKRGLEKKFYPNEKLKALLLSTGDKKLIQASPVNSFWGEGAEKKGENHLGKLLMALRSEIKEAEEMPDLGQEGGDPISAECKAGTKPGEKYAVACDRAKLCLKTIAKARMLLGGSDGLAIYSAKFSTMLERIAAAPGSSLVYSQFLDMEGIGIFRVAMDVNGYAPIRITLVGGVPAFTKETEESLRKGPGKQPRYITFSGGETQEERRAALDIFNAKFAELPESMNKILSEAGYTDNKLGELCRVFCITSAGAEGLSLRNVRAVHIMEPYWNEVRLRQVKGRAIRIGSHLDLPEDQRDVSIYTYVSCFSEEAQRDRTGDNKIDETLLLHDSVDAKKAAEYGLPMKPGMTTYVLTTDEIIYAISERKRKIIESLECIMKSAAVDCEISYEQNKDGAFRCLPLKGKVGDFVYKPNLEQDILDASKFEDEKSICSGELKPREFFQPINKIIYFLREVFGQNKTVTGYDVFEAVEVVDHGKKIRKKKMPEVKLGTVGVRMVDGAPQPGPPVNIKGNKPK